MLPTEIQYNNNFTVSTMVHLGNRRNFPRPQPLGNYAAAQRL